MLLSIPSLLASRTASKAAAVKLVGGSVIGLDVEKSIVGSVVGFVVRVCVGLLFLMVLVIGVVPVLLIVELGVS